MGADNYCSFTKRILSSEREQADSHGRDAVREARPPAP